MTRPAASILLALALASGCRPCPRGPETRQLRLAFTSGAAAPPFTLDYTDTSLKGDLRAIVTPVPAGVPVTLSLWIRSGSDDERDGEAGASHLARHVLLDPGTDADASAAAAAVTDAGGRVEAWTSRSATVVTVTAPPGRLREAVAVLGPLVRPPEVLEEPLARARQAVEREADAFWAQPLARARDRLHSLMLAPAHASGLFPPLEGLDGTGASQVTAFIKRTYTSGRMVLGASLPQASLAALDALPAPRKGAAKPAPAPPPVDGPMAALLEPGPAGLPGHAGSLLAAGVLLPALSDGQGAAAHLLARRLAARGPGTVHEHLTRLGGGLDEVDAVLDVTPRGSLMTISGRVEEGGELEAVQAVSEAVAELAVLPPGGPGLEHAALETAAAWMIDLQDPFVAPSRLARHAFLTQAALPPEDHLGLLFDVDPQDVASLARTLLEPGTTGLVLVPASGKGHDGPQAPDAEEIAARAAEALDGMRSVAGRAADQCKAGPAGASALAPGIRVAALRTTGSGAVAISALAGAGTLSDPPAREGSAALLSLLMARSLDEAVRQSPGLDPGFVASSTTHEMHGVGVHLVVPPDRWLEGVLAVRSAILSPALDATSFEAARQKLLSLAGAEPDAGTAAERDALASLLGLGPGYQPAGSVVSLGALSVQQVRGFHEAALARDVVVAIAGQIDEQQACAAASVAFRPALVEPQGEGIALLAPTPTAAPAVQPAGSQGSGAMAWVAMAWPMPGRADEGHAASLLLARVLGGDGGILARSVIHEGGLAESIDATAWAGPDWGVLLVHVRTPSANVQAVIEAVAGTLAALADSPPPNEALDDAREAVELARAQELALPATAARLVAAEALAGLAGPPEDMSDALDAVGRNAIAELVATYVAASSPAVAVHAP